MFLLKRLNIKGKTIKEIVKERGLNIAFPDKPYLTISELVSLGISRGLIYYLIKTKKLYVLKDKKTYLIPLEKTFTGRKKREKLCFNCHYYLPKGKKGYCKINEKTVLPCHTCFRWTKKTKLSNFQKVYVRV